MSNLEDMLAFQLKVSKTPKPEREYRFHETRKWRFDFAWPAYFLAVEVEGGVFSNGRHSRGAGFEADIEKYNTAMLLGWRILRCTAKTIKSGAILHDIEKALYGN